MGIVVMDRPVSERLLFPRCDGYHPGMNPVLLCLASLLMLQTLSATEGDGPCVTLESGVIFRTPDVVEMDLHALEKYPEVLYSQDDSRQPVGLTWKLKDAGTESASEKIAEVHGREIRRFVFWQKDGNKHGDGILCVWLGIAVPAPSGGSGFRPFLVFPGDDTLSHWDCYAAYDDEDKFTVKLEIGLEGTGVFWTTATVQIQKQGPLPLRLESGGRGKELPDVLPYRPADAR